MYKRHLEKKNLERLKEIPVVALLGSRQIGKTTLAFEISKQYPSL